MNAFVLGVYKHSPEGLTIVRGWWTNSEEDMQIHILKFFETIALLYIIHRYSIKQSISGLT